MEFIYPVFIGRQSGTSVDSLESVDWSCFGVGGMPNVSVKSVEDKLTEHLERLLLGDPLSPRHTVRAKISANQGRKVEGKDCMEKFTFFPRKHTHSTKYFSAVHFSDVNVNRVFFEPLHNRERCSISILFLFFLC